MTEPSFKCAIKAADRGGRPCERECPNCQFLRTGERTGHERLPMCYQDAAVKSVGMPEPLRRALIASGIVGEAQRPFELPDMRDRVTRL